LRRQVVDDAAERSLHALALALARGRTIDDYASWVFRVAANSAKKLLRTPRTVSLDHVHLEIAPMSSPQTASSATADTEPAPPSAILRKRISRLTPRQQLVVKKLLQPQMSLHRAAFDLAMDRSSLRRTLRRALLALRYFTELEGPPPSSCT
jgi:DNA-directed RNA polymerase specialized sigma24 family protein